MQLFPLHRLVPHARLVRFGTLFFSLPFYIGSFDGLGPRTG